MSRLILGLDLDDTCLAAAETWVPCYAADFGIELAVADLTSWDDIVGRTHFTCHAEWLAWMDATNVWADMLPHDGVGDALDALWEEGFDLRVFTARHIEARHVTLDAVEAHLHIPAKHVTFTGPNKADSCYRYDVLVDDSPTVLAGCHAARRPTVRMVRPWNESVAALCTADLRDWTNPGHVVATVRSTLACHQLVA